MTVTRKQRAQTFGAASGVRVRKVSVIHGLTSHNGQDVSVTRARIHIVTTGERAATTVEAIRCAPVLVRTTEHSVK